MANGDEPPGGTNPPDNPPKNNSPPPDTDPNKPPPDPTKPPPPEEKPKGPKDWLNDPKAKPGPQDTDQELFRTGWMDPNVPPDVRRKAREEYEKRNGPLTKDEWQKWRELMGYGASA